METLTLEKTDWIKLTNHLGRQFSRGAAKADRLGAFVEKNYGQLRLYKYFSAMIPEELGGGGMTHSEMCEVIKTIGRYCGSTALALAMHQHLIGTTVWKYKTKGAGEALLRRVVRDQTILVSTGARDWLQSNGTMVPVEGGYLLTAKKSFASQSAIGHIAISSAPFQCQDGSWEVLHFPVSLKAKGVTVIDDWNTMGMRGTGSQTIEFNEVFIPAESIGLRRPQEGFHMVWNVVLTVAMPLIMSAYVGIAESAFNQMLDQGKVYKKDVVHFPYQIGKIKNNLIAAQSQLQSMISITKDLDFAPKITSTVDILSYKTNVAQLSIQVVEDVLNTIGGQSYYKKNRIERLFRDVQAARFHPLPEWDQWAFTGKTILEQHLVDK